MINQGTVDSWNHSIDECLGKARAVLVHVTQDFLAEEWTGDQVEAAVALSEAWRSLATQWSERTEWDLPEEPPKRTRAKAKTSDGNDSA